MNKTGFFQPRRFTALLATAGLFCAAPAVSLADPSDTNHASATGSANANSNGTSNSNVNGLGAGGTAPVPEASTYAALGTLLAAAAYAHRRRRIAAQA